MRNKSKYFGEDGYHPNQKAHEIIHKDLKRQLDKIEKLKLKDILD